MEFSTYHNKINNKDDIIIDTVVLNNLSFNLCTKEIYAANTTTDVIANPIHEKPTLQKNSSIMQYVVIHTIKSNIIKLIIL